jgi:uncharacterized membrane protein YphA (DoxX/SURF4 family)
MAPQALALLRIVAGLLFLEHGTAHLLGFPASPFPRPTFMTLLWFQGVIELRPQEPPCRVAAGRSAAQASSGAAALCVRGCA